MPVLLPVIALGLACAAAVPGLGSARAGAPAGGGVAIFEDQGVHFSAEDSARYDAPPVALPREGSRRRAHARAREAGRALPDHRLRPGEAGPQGGR